MKYTNEDIDQVFSESINRMNADPYVMAMKKARAAAGRKMRPKDLRKFALTLDLSEQEREAVIRIHQKNEK